MAVIYQLKLAKTFFVQMGTKISETKLAQDTTLHWQVE
jgi:uncharacterized protein YneF (UPF0154 family)